MTYYDSGSRPSSRDLINPDDYSPPSTQTAMTHTKFRPEFVHTSVDVLSMTHRLMLVREFAGANFLFHGLSGTGKTEFGRYIAKMLKMPVTVVHTGDIMFSKLGATERVLVKIFQEASRTKAVLVFDEADSFLYNRRDIKYQWERQLVNEFLRLFESHDQPVICTTNLIDELDPAVLRRFMFKVEFKPLSADQAAQAFRHYFGLPVPDYMKTLSTLALGDFGIVFKKAKVLGCLKDPTALCQLFYEEALARHQQNVAKAESKRQRKDAA